MTTPPTSRTVSEADPENIEADIPKQRERSWKLYLDAALGLKNYWYPVFFSRELAAGETIAEEVCGQRMIFKRLSGGDVYAVQDRCPHRGVAFSARPECLSENTLTCWLHGFTYDVRDGRLVQIISHPDSKLKGKLAVRTYPVREALGLVWVFMGDEEVPFEHDLPPLMQRALSGEQRRAFFPVLRMKIACDWRLAIENGFDPGHIYGHRTAELFHDPPQHRPLASYPDAKVLGFETPPDSAAHMVMNYASWVNVWSADVEGVTIGAEPEGDGGSSDAEGLLDYRFDMTEIDRDAGCYLPCLYAAAGFPDARQAHLEWYVPVDEKHHMYIIVASLPVDSDEEERRFFEECEGKWANFIWSKDPDIVGFNNFDAFGREQIAHAYTEEDFWHRERLYKPDFTLTEWRKFVSRVARGVMTRTDMSHKDATTEPGEIRYLH